MTKRTRMTILFAIAGIIFIAAAMSAILFWDGAARAVPHDSLLARYLPVFRGCNPPLPRESLSIGSTTWSVEVASTAVEQACGLSGRSGLGDQEGMLFPFSKPSVQNFWMKDMNFPIDMIWISGDTVVGSVERASPQPGVPLWKLTIYSSPDGTDKVLEVNSGTIAKYGIRVGDRIEIGK